MLSMFKTIVLPLLSVWLIATSCRDTESSSKQRDNGITIQQKVSPVLMGRQRNPVLQIQLRADGAQVSSEDTVSSLSITTEGTTDIEDIKSVDVFYAGDEGSLGEAVRFGGTDEIDEVMEIAGRQQLKGDNNFFWVSYELKEGAELLNRVDAGLEQLTFESGDSWSPEEASPPGGKRIGVVVRQGGQQGVHTYRIPGLVTTNEGTLIAAYDIRYDNASDLQGDIDVGINRSTDGGQTWEEMQVIMDMGEWGGLPEEQNGIGDPSILVDDETGTIWVAALWTHGMPGERAWTASGPGIEPEETGQFMLTKSEDDGKTWSEPVNITGQIKDPEWQLLLQGPGRGITMDDGTLVFPAQFKDEKGMPYATIIYSKDHGESWSIGSGAKSNTTEAQVVQLSDGSLMLNMRDNRGGARSVYTTDDLGESWQKHPTSRSALIEPVSMASLIEFPCPEDELSKYCLLFSNPNSTESRKNMAIKMSTDDGLSWPTDQQILLNENQGYGYSCLTPVDEQAVGILYEGAGDLFFQKVLIKELLADETL